MLKNILKYLGFISLLLTISCFAQQNNQIPNITSTVQKNEQAKIILFQKFNNDSIELAKKNNKNILIYIYSNHCPACKLTFMNVLQDKNIVSFINNNFVAIQANVDSELDREYIEPIIQQIQDNSIPLFVIFNPNKFQNDEIIQFTHFSGYTFPQSFLIKLQISQQVIKQLEFVDNMKNIKFF